MQPRNYLFASLLAMLMATGCSEPTSSEGTQAIDSISVDSASVARGKPDSLVPDSSALVMGIKKDSPIVAPPQIQKPSRPKEKKEYLPYLPGKSDAWEIRKRDSLQKAAKKLQKDTVKANLGRPVSR